MSLQCDVHTLWEGFWGIVIFGTKIVNITYKCEMSLIGFIITNRILNVCIIVLNFYTGIAKIGLLDVNFVLQGQHK